MPLKFSLSKLKAVYKKWALILFNTTVFFILLNIIFYLIPDPLQQKAKFHQSLCIQANQALYSDTALIKRVYPGLTLAEINDRIKAPDIKSHPVLPFMNVPVDNACYRVGVENMRYDSYIKSDKDAFQSLNNSVWVLGGSTAFGRGVCNNETISCYLNLFDTTQRYINLGCMGYTQWCETERLILLLRKGYRPKSLIFIDGLNDLMAISRFGFEALETPGRNQHAYSMEYGPDQVAPNKKNIYSIPVIHWWYAYLASKINDGDLPVTENIYLPESSYNKDGYLHYLRQKTYLNLPGPQLKEKMIRYYEGNLALIKTLSEAYKFKYTIVFQPIGILHHGNSFVKNQSQFDSAFFAVKQVAYLQKNMCELIKQGRFTDYMDLTELHKHCQEPYIDLTHYSPAFNRLIAKTILEKRQRTNGQNEQH